MTFTRFQKEPHYWVIKYNGEIVGCVQRQLAPRGGYHWFWATWVLPAEHGYAETYEQARDRFKAAIGRWNKCKKE